MNFHRCFWFLLICITTAQAQPRIEFEVASLKPNTSGTTSMKFPAPADGKFQASNFPLKALISFAYGVLGTQMYGAPAWINSERFDVDARSADKNATREQFQQMLQALLVDRFALQVHRETKDLPAYELLPAKTGPRLKPADPRACQPAGANGNRDGSSVTCGAFFTGAASLDGRSMSMAQFCNALGIVLGRPVADRTGVAGVFDIHLEFDPNGVDLGNGPAGLSTDATALDGRPSIFSAIQQQLGLRFESHKQPEEVLVIDRLQRLPAEN